MFEAPLLLWGMFAAGIPVILHLTGRSQPIVHRFPAMRFILRSQRASSRALRLKHLLVLLLRMLAVMLICLALARPYLASSGVAALGTFFGVILAAAAGWAIFRREFVAGAVTLVVLAALYASLPDLAPQMRGSLRGDVVIVLDQSQSMAYQESDGTRFDLARRQANEMLDRLSSDSRVALLLAGKSVDRAQGRLTYHIDAVREKLKDAKITSGGLDLGRALQAAEEVLARDQNARTSGAPRQIVVFTDMQRNAFETAAMNRLAPAIPAIPATGSKDTPEKPSLVLVDVASDDARNGGVLSLTLPGTILPVDSTETLAVKVRLLDGNHGSLVELFLDGKRVDQNQVNGNGREIADVEFRFQTGAAGPHALTVRLADGDRLPLDQEFHVTYVAGRPDRALILEAPASVNGDRHGSGFFVAKALDPDASTDENSLGMSGLSTVLKPLEELTAAKLVNYKVVILADCGALSESSWAALQQWTNDGGGLFVWAGGNTDPASLRKYGFHEFAIYHGLLPATIGEMVTYDPPREMKIVAAEHPLLAHFTQDVTRELSHTPVRRSLKVTPDNVEGGSTVVLSAGDAPLLLEKSYGRGRVLLFTSDPGPNGSELVKHGGAFVTLMLDAVRLLAQSEADIHARYGQPVTLTLPPQAVPADGKLFWTAPGSKDAQVLRVENLNAIDTAPVSKPVAVEAPGPVTVTVPPLTATGVHRFSWTPTSSKPPTQRLVAVNHDAAEVDLTKSRKADVEKVLAPAKPELVKNYLDAELFKAQAALSSDERRHEFSASLVVVLLALLLGESFLSNRFYRGDDVAVSAVQETEAAHGTS